MNLKRKLITICLVLMGNFSYAADNVDKLQQVIDGPQRSVENKARDIYRHPYKTLKFFGLTESMTVAEITPGGGWYTEILAPYLKDHGQYIAAGYDIHSKSDYYRTNAEKFQAKLDADPEHYSKAHVSVMQLPDQLDFAPAETVDMVVSFRNVHHWHSKGETEKVFGAIFKSLKPGGVFGLVQHRAGYDQPKDTSGALGYVSPKEVIDIAKKVGFALEAKSEVNANPKDTKDYEKGVWTLPPVYRLKDQDKDKYQKIGESDRMTLKFVKKALK
ncbi:MAG: methyltransferase [Gammaproteobacteria bacterium CG22_combo_CG10-13_8_21_14_all_40_8]|nr:MAG: methyltransferase [Gammaproteobacteria bacterium CG22_combo_CG10-13_8_21_14_all_40_8]